MDSKGVSSKISHSADRTSQMPYSISRGHMKVTIHEELNRTSFGRTVPANIGPKELGGVISHTLEIMQATRVGEKMKARAKDVEESKNSGVKNVEIQLSTQGKTWTQIRDIVEPIQIIY
ncbi:hypothetical protein HAX54_005235 [Datura stramonium]|uniref:Uncharacterized protein n=1 Tax=Datura stramonium TaxID=4076 RepID=A0ABS8WTF3_DATST|nr:hypothetical protein [Datura stramonium]